MRKFKEINGKRFATIEENVSIGKHIAYRVTEYDTSSGKTELFFCQCVFERELLTPFVEHYTREGWKEEAE